MRERGKFSRKKKIRFVHISVTIAHPETQNKRHNFIVPFFIYFGPQKMHALGFMYYKVLKYLQHCTCALKGMAKGKVCFHLGGSRS